jgi:predicted alpha/beta superfamily hydrolase
MRLLTIIYFVCCAHSVFAAGLLTIGEKHHLFSEVLNEDREYWVYLPDNYADSSLGKAHYPVVYLLDGDFYFYAHVAMQKNLAKGLYQYMPETIIVGIMNTDRSRDLTPTQSQLVHQGKVIYQSSGGAAAFHRFLTGELRNRIDSSYRTNGYNILVGHSFGGLFAIYSLLNFPGTFQSIVSHDPSLWWDNQLLLKQADERWEGLPLEGVNLYVSLAHEKASEGDRFRHAQSIQEFCLKHLGETAGNGLRAKWEYFANEDHGTICFPASFQAMKFLFEGICLPVKQVPYQPQLVADTFESLSQKLGFRFIPGEKQLDDLAAYCLSVEQNKSAEILLQANVRNHPGSARALLKLGDYFMLMNEERQAREYWQKALDIGTLPAEEANRKLRIITNPTDTQTP